jgi:type II secretory pathway pseudopilin PulG
LTELAVVLVIISILIGGLLLPLSSQIEMRNSNDTKAAMAEIREALLGYVAVNGYPAGVLPWATLGVAEKDAWGRRYSYRVTPEFSNAPPLPLFKLSSTGDIKVSSSAGGIAVATAVPAVVISHGKNGNAALHGRRSAIT